MATKSQYSSAAHSDAEDNYSDDFIHDEEHDRSEKTKQSPARARGRSKGRGRGRGGRRGPGGGSHSRAASDSGMDVVAKRLLSASQQKVRELQNELEDLRRQTKIITEENKLYKRLQHKQEKALEKFENRESELPQLIQAHNNEVRTLKEQLRRTRERYDKTDRYLRDAEDELERVKTRLKKYKDLADQQELVERSELSHNLKNAELKIEEQEAKVKELELHMEILKKNHRHELGIERARSKETQQQLQQAQDVNKKLEEQIKEKEKLLELRNIYSNRLQPSSYGGTPHDSPPLWKQAVKKRAPSLTDLTPREKAKVYEEKRKVEERKKKAKVVKQQKWEEASGKHTGTKENHTSFKSLPHQDGEDDFWKRQEEEYKQQRDQESGEKEREQEEAERKKEEREREQFLRQRDKMKRDLEEREKAERLRREADEKERRDRERVKKEREEWEHREQAERERKEQEQWERDRKAKEDQERRAQEERERLDNDPKLAEERRKKDELLRRLKQLDNNRDSSLPQDPFSPVITDKTKTANGGGDLGGDTSFTTFSNNSIEKKQQRDPFLVTRADSTDSTATNKKDYAFSRPVENLHKGKPSHEDVSVPYLERQRRSRAGKEDLEIGGYQPSFTGAGKSGSGKMQKKPKSMFEDDDISKTSSVQKDKKSKLMADLFGPQAAASQSKKEDSGEFFLTNKNPPPQQVHSKPSSGFPWDDDKTSSRAGGTTTVNRRESSVLFGGGAALVDDDSPANSSSAVLLPRRQRHPPTTFSSKPAVTAVDNLDDDIEEVIL